MNRSEIKSVSKGTVKFPIKGRSAQDYECLELYPRNLKDLRDGNVLRGLINRMIVFIKGDRTSYNI